MPTVVAVCANGGAEYDPQLLITVTGPDGQRVGSLEFAWHWHDNPPAPVKYRVFAQYVPVRVETVGVYTMALHQSPDDTDTDHQFPLPIYQRNPLLQANQ
ncbi:hypothetical protein [Mycolicibacterium sp.]|uniref:hypothetical protein n=1 Tax=Mycolicibacterium sp. TaxID=2320850 RepID=UPI003D12219B